MSNDPVDGGTVTQPGQPDKVLLTCNGHSIELSDEEADVVVDLWADYADVRDPNAELRCKTKLAGLLRDARQDPQPTADTRHADGCQSDLPLSMCQCDLPTARPEQDDTPGIDFDALPIGTVLKTYNGYYVTKGGNGNWFSSEEALAEPDHLLAPYTVVYQPAPLSPGECHRPAPVSPYEGLRAVLAGRDDADELIEYASKHWNYVDESDAVTSVLGAVGDAARSGGAT